MKLLANENFPLASVSLFEKSGFDIIAIGKDYSGSTDSEVMELAIRENRTILTFDRDYGELIFKKGFKPKPGVIYLRWKSFLPHEPGEYLIMLFQTVQIKFQNRLTVIRENSIRQKVY